MQSEKCLQEAIRLVTGPRANDYGDKTITHCNIAALWSSYLGKNVSAHDVAMCMLLMKVARIKHKATPDSYIDIAGYAAIAAEIQKED